MINDVPRWLVSQAKQTFRNAKQRRRETARERRRNRLSLEMLEPRVVLSVVTWSTAAAPTGGDWDVASNWVGNKVPGASDTAVIKGLTGGSIVYLNSGGADTVNSLTTDSSATLKIISGSLSFGVASSSTLGGPVSVLTGASLKVGAAANVQIAAGQTLAVDGTLNFGSGDIVTLNSACCPTTQAILVNGTLTAASTTFNGGGGSTVTVNSGGIITPTGSTFNIPISVPYTDVPSLAGNVSFNQVLISNATLLNGTTLNLNSLGTNTANFSYVLPGGFTVAAGSTFAVGPNVPITLSAGQTLLDNGTVSLASNDIFTLNSNCCPTTQAIVVNGTLTANGTTFTGGNASTITVNAAGIITPSGSTFNIPITVPYTDVPSLAGNVSFNQVLINNATLLSGTTLNLNSLGTNTANFSYVLPGGFTVAAGSTFAVGPNVPITLSPGQTLLDNGTVSFGSGDIVTLNSGCCPTTQAILVNGTLTATDTTFNGGNASTITVNAAGIITPTGSTFNIPITVPYTDVPSLAGNVSFNQVLINNATLLSGTTLNLNSLGTNTANFSYVLPGGFTVAAGSTFAVGPNVPIALSPGQTLLDNGTVSFGSGDIVTLNSGCCPTTQAILVNGTLTATDATFNGGNASTITVNAAGIITPTGSTFNIPITVPYTDVPSLAGNVSFNQVLINNATLLSGTTLNLNSLGTNTANFSYVLPGGFTVAAGSTLAVGPNVPIALSPGQTLLDNGTVSFGSGDVVTLNSGCCPTTQAILVNGTLTATDAIFNGGNASTITVNAGGIITPTGSTLNIPIYVPYTDVPSLAGNISFTSVNINSGNLSSGTLYLNLIGTDPSKLTYVFPAGFTVSVGATMAVGPNVPVIISAGQTLFDNGTVSFASGDTVTLNSGCCPTTQEIVVSGTLTATGATFAGGNGSNITVKSAGIITPTDSVFNIPIFVPYSVVPSLAGNVSFDQVDITSAILPSGTTLDLNLIGTDPTNLSYNFPAGFTVAAGATIDVGPYVSVSIGSGQVLTDNGNFNLTIGDLLTLPSGGTQVVVGGALSANGATITGSGNATIAINSGGSLSITNSTYSAPGLTLNPNSTDSMFDDVFSGKLTVDSAAITIQGGAPTITGNDFSGVGNNGIVATGDANASIDLEGNYWGTSVLATIDGKILDHNDPPGNRPTIDYQPFVTSASGTVATPVTTTFSTSSQIVPITATVSTLAGVAINEGFETFTVLDGTEVIGQTTAPLPVSNGTVTASYTLPAGTPAGQYFIQAVYSGSLQYRPSSDSLHYLTINPAVTNTTVGSTSTTYSGVTDQTLPLSAQVGSTAAPSARDRLRSPF